VPTEHEVYAAGTGTVNQLAAFAAMHGRRMAGWAGVEPRAARSGTRGWCRGSGLACTRCGDSIDMSGERVDETVLSSTRRCMTKATSPLRTLVMMTRPVSTLDDAVVRLTPMAADIRALGVQRLALVRFRVTWSGASGQRRRRARGFRGG
jgi:hypothetical protein